MERSATLDTIDGRPVLRFERPLAHPPEKVWKAITDPAELAHWFPARVEAELRVGAPMRFVIEGGPTVDTMDGEIVEFDPPKVYAFRWGEDMLRWEIVPEGSGCRLYFSHVLSEAHGGRQAAGRDAAGWDECLASLWSWLDGAPRDLEQPHEAMLGRMEAYIEAFGLAEGEVADLGGEYRVRFERDLAWQPLERVWALFTEQADPAGPAEPAEGGQPPPRATNGYLAAGPVSMVDPPRVLEYEWLHDGPVAGTVRWEFAADGTSGTRVVLTQTVPSHLAHLRATVLAAWQTHLELFFAALLGDVRRSGVHVAAERTERLRHMYAERLGGR